MFNQTISLSQARQLQGDPDFVDELAQAVTESSRWLEFAAGSGDKTPKCKPTSFPCGKSCQPAKTKTGKATQCQKALTGQPANYADWLKTQAVNASNHAPTSKPNAKPDKSVQKAKPPDFVPETPQLGKSDGNGVVMSVADADQELDALGYTGISKSNVLAAYKKLGDSPIDQAVKVALLQKKDGEDERRGWLSDRLMPVHKLATKGKLSYREIEDLAQTANEQGNFRNAASRSGHAMSLMVEEAYKNQDKDGKDLLAWNLGDESDRVTKQGSTQAQAIQKELNNRRKQVVQRVQKFEQVLAKRPDVAKYLTQNYPEYQIMTSIDSAYTSALKNAPDISKSDFEKLINKNKNTTTPVTPNSASTQTQKPASGSLNAPNSTPPAASKPKDGGNNGVKPQVPKNKKILGNPELTKDELKFANLKPDDQGVVKLTAKQVDRINLIRNGHDSFEDMLNAPPDHKQDVVLYAGERVKMTITKDGDVGFTVDDSYDANDAKGGVPSQELRDMTRAWLKYAKSPASDRVFWNVPWSETEGENRQQSRTDMYRKYGFSDPDKDPTGTGAMVLDNRKDKTKDLHPEEDKAGLTKILYPERATANAQQAAIAKAKTIESFGDLRRIAQDLPDDVLMATYNNIRASMGNDPLPLDVIKTRLAPK